VSLFLNVFLKFVTVKSNLWVSFGEGGMKMADRTFFVSLSIQEAAALIEKKLADADQVFESHSEAAGVEQCILVYQKYFFRNSNYAALTAVIDDLSEKTKVTAVVTGGSGSLFPSWDWGAADRWLEEFSDGFTKYIID
jgi:hypothetical protein